MTDSTIHYLKQKHTFLSMEEQLLKQAEILYRYGYFPDTLSAAQMAAVGEHIRSAETLKQARKAIEEFINRQIQKQKNKEKFESGGPRRGSVVTATPWGIR